jgi:predicted O-methyltransferase YrrM
MFSIPLNPKLNQSQFNQFLSFARRHKDLIYDVYFTCRISPFDQDAMGDVFVNEPQDMIENALIIQEELGIKVSATFNNLEVRPDQANLDLWIENFRPLYERGIRSCTLPHTHWVLTGKIQKEFPELFIKNTILRNLNTAGQVAKAAESGFHYINIDRALMRDTDTLERIRQVKEKYGVKIALLANEGCLGNCPVMEEHFQFNNTRKDGPQYFTDPISRISCPKWDVLEPASSLKSATLPPWREDWEEMFKYVDVLKMHGRESVIQMFSTMNIIERYARGEEILFDEFNDYLQDKNLEGKPIEAWRKFIKNCKFDCWDCNKCDKLFEAKNKNPTSEKVIRLVKTLAFHDNELKLEIGIEGLSSRRVQNLLTHIGDISSKYLEVGSYLGASGASVLRSSSVEEATFVDHWKDQVQPANGDVLPSNNKQKFIENIKKYKADRTLKVFDCDMLSVDKTELKGIDFFFYDGAHDFQSTSDAIRYYASSLANEAIIMIDDANWEGVVDGAEDGIQKAGLEVLFKKIWLNNQESKEQWWNGFFIAVVKKNK